jgi:hypothetical protein
MPVFAKVPRPRPLPWGAASLVGLLVVSIALVLLTGSATNAYGLFFLSVVCTAGIGAFFWVGLVNVVGMATLYVVDQLLRWCWRPQGTGLFSSASSVRVLRERQRVLEQYLARRLVQGNDPVRVRRELLEAGWGEPQLEEAFLTVRGR